MLVEVVWLGCRLWWREVPRGLQDGQVGENDPERSESLGCRE